MEAQDTGWGARWRGVREGSLEEVTGRQALKEEVVGAGPSRQQADICREGPMSWHPTPFSSHAPLHSSWKGDDLFGVLSPGFKQVEN